MSVDKKELSLIKLMESKMAPHLGQQKARKKEAERAKRSASV